MIGNPVGKKEARLTFPLRFPSLVFWLFLTTSPPQARAQRRALQKLCPHQQQITPQWQTAVRAGQLPPSSQPPYLGGGARDGWPPLPAPTFLLPSPWVQLASDSGPLKSSLQPTKLGPRPAPPAPGSPAESSPLLPEGPITVLSAWPSSPVLAQK